MRKRIICSMLSFAFLCTSCLGSFSAFNNLKDWNQEVTSNKFVNNVLFWVLNIVPVYALFYAGDVLIFNTIEFWSGSNPIAMGEGEIETQIIEKEGVKYEMIASKNTMKIRVLSGERAGDELSLVYEPSDKSWSAVKDGQKIKLSSYQDGIQYVYMPNGETVSMDPNMGRKEGLALLNSKIASYEKCMMLVSN